MNKRLSSALRLRGWMKLNGIKYSAYRGNCFIAVILADPQTERFTLASMIIDFLKYHEPDTIFICKHYWRDNPEPYAIIAAYDPTEKYDLWDFTEKTKIRKWDYLDIGYRLWHGMKLLFA